MGSQNDMFLFVMLLTKMKSLFITEVKHKVKKI